MNKLQLSRANSEIKQLRLIILVEILILYYLMQQLRNGKLNARVCSS